jgi:hypothetical protein
MRTDNYKSKITVNADADKVFWALTEGMHEWWTVPDAPMKKVGDRSKFTFPPGKSYWTFEASVLEPGKCVEMICVDALHLHEGQPEEVETEWLGTRVVWNIETMGPQTNIHIEHHGLVPSLHCFSICEEGWDFFFTDSLKAYLDTGAGKPHRAPSE